MIYNVDLILTKVNSAIYWYARVTRPNPVGQSTNFRNLMTVFTYKRRSVRIINDGLWPMWIVEVRFIPSCRIICWAFPFCICHEIWADWAKDSCTVFCKGIAGSDSDQARWHRNSEVIRERPVGAAAYVCLVKYVIDVDEDQTSVSSYAQHHSQHWNTTIKYCNTNQENK